ncbi:Zinc finger, RING-type [Dillenia turbinata]|uniref:RING-type E3 ubiquitin transferase n=1 Tax=Dillenia turbinata TaxID=194707 RepID=A0AAN8VKS8_9MAGN
MEIVAERSNIQLKNPSFRRPRNKPIPIADPKPKPKPTISNLIRSTFSNNATPKPNNHRRLSAFSGLGCASASPQVSARAIIRSSADWENKKAKRKTKKKKKKRTMMNNSNVVVDVPDVCCGPGIGFSSDAALVDCVESKRPVSSTSRSRGRNCNRNQSTNPVHLPMLDLPPHLCSSRLYHSSRNRSPGGLSEIILFQSSLLFAEGLNEYDHYGNWRLDVDNMTYEELLELSDRIGYVGSGLREEEIASCLSRSKFSILDSFASHFKTVEGWKCSICQEEYVAHDELGKLGCDHSYHTYCIKQWLLLKNACPICKTAAAAF